MDVISQKIMIKAPLSPQQQAIFDLIKNYIDRFQYPPKQAYIAENLSMNASAVHRDLRAMQKKGYIKFNRYKQRSIRLKVE